MPKFQSVLRSPDGHENGFGDLGLPRTGERVYRGERGEDGEHRVWFEDRKDGQPEPPERRALPLHREVRDHSPTGFTWGYGGSGPAQLALALLMDALGDAELAEAHYQDFKWACVARWGDTWSITAREIREFVHRGTAKRPGSRSPKFSPGQIVATSNALSSLPPANISAALGRHLSGDWGELDVHDWQANEDALRDGGRLFSAYRTSNGEKFWIITEADRSATTVLLPEDY